MTKRRCYFVHPESDCVWSEEVTEKEREAILLADGNVSEIDFDRYLELKEEQESRDRVL